MESDFQVGKSLTTFDACGCGEDYAMGALAAGDTGITAKERIERALEIASKFSAGVAPPFFVLTSGEKTK